MGSIDSDSTICQSLLQSAGLAPAPVDIPDVTAVVFQEADDHPAFNTQRFRVERGTLHILILDESFLPAALDAIERVGDCIAQFRATSVLQVGDEGPAVDA